MVTCESGCVWSGSIADYKKHKETCTLGIGPYTSLIEKEYKMEIDLLKEKCTKQEAQVKHLKLELSKKEQRHHDMVRGLEREVAALRAERKKLTITTENLTVGLKAQEAAHKKQVARMRVEAATKDRKQRGEIQQLQKRVSILKRERQKLLTSTKASSKLFKEAKAAHVHNLKAIEDGLRGKDRPLRDHRKSVTSLAALISQDLEERPEYMDANKIYECVQKIYQDLKNDTHGNPDFYDCDVKLLLAICGASTWFTRRQWHSIDRWYKESWTSAE